jgi:predicted NACHT family NTPase
MAKRSLKATPTGIAISKRAFQRTGWTQEYLASEVGLNTRQSIWKFFSGRAVERHIFIDICFRLDLDWVDIAEPPVVDPLLPIPTAAPASNQVHGWVQQVRLYLQDQLHHQCRPLLTPFPQAHPLWIESIYTEVDFLPDITSQRWLETTELEATVTSESLPCLPFPNPNQRLTSFSVINQTHRLVILGKPGAGKSTLLKQLALQCSAGYFKADAIPLFITLHHLFTPLVTTQDSSPGINLKHHLINQLSTSGLTPPQAETILQQGNLLLLMDGLDEVTAARQADLYAQIQQLAEAFPSISILISQRTATLNYRFPGFEYAEIADLSDHQIETFVKQWFQGNEQAQPSPHATLETTTVARRCLKHLYGQKASACRELARNPLFLTLLCSVFQSQGQFPRDLSRLYQHCLNLLLGDWDKAKGVQRSWGTQGHQPAVYLKILGHLATLSLEQTTYCYEKSTLLHIIATHLSISNPATVDPEQRQLDSERILKVILANTGLLTEQAKDIYTFSYLILQKYLVSRKMVLSLIQEPQDSQLAELADKFTHPQWQEVSVMILGSLTQKHPFIHRLKEHLKSTIMGDKTLQKLINCLEQTLGSLQLAEKADRIQSIYRTLFHTDTPNLWITPDGSLDSQRVTDRKYQGMEYAWELSPQQRQQLQSYYLVNYLLTETMTGISHTESHSIALLSQVA